jgi:retinol dehydrogenase-12
MGNWVFAPAAGVDFSNLDGRGPAGYNPWVAYGQSKLANILHAKELQRRMDAEGAPVVAASVHPGAILSTSLGRHSLGGSVTTTLQMLAFPRVLPVSLLGRYKSIPEGVATTLYAALAPVAGRQPESPGAPGATLTPGGYYTDCALVETAGWGEAKIHDTAGDAALARRLWDVSQELLDKAWAE